MNSSGFSIIRWQSRGRLVCLRSDCDDRRADGDVGDEMAVHDVDVDDGAAAALGRGDFVGQAGKIRGKYGWDELDHYGNRVQGASGEQGRQHPGKDRSS
jgi:hypothetical protein